MFKKMIALVLIFAMLVPFSSAAAADEPSATPTVEEILSEYSDSTRSDLTAEIITDTTELVVFDAEREQQINELFALRGRLEINFEENEAAIRDIDNQLRQLGVEEISHSELLSKMGYDVLPTANIQPAHDISWTSRCTIAVYRGQQYELQIFEGVPTSGNSILRIDHSPINIEATGIIAGSTKVVALLGVSAISSVPVVGNILSPGITFLQLASDCYSAIHDSLQSTTVIDNVSGTALVSQIVHMKLVFVKGAGSSDSYQILGYMGNFDTYIISTLTAVDIWNGTELMTYHEVSLGIEDTVHSAHYDDYTIALQNYYEYRNEGNDQFWYDYKLTHIDIEVFGEENRYAVPWAMGIVTFD